LKFKIGEIFVVSLIKGIRRDPKEYKVLVGTCVDMCPEKVLNIIEYFVSLYCQFSVVFAITL